MCINRENPNNIMYTYIFSMNIIGRRSKTVSEFWTYFHHSDISPLTVTCGTSQIFFLLYAHNNYSLPGSFVIFTVKSCLAIDRKVWSQKVLVNLLFLTICFQESWIFFCIADLQKYQHVHISNKYQNLLFLHIWDA